MRRLYLVHVRGRGFDLYEADDGQRPKLLAESLTVSVLSSFLLEASNELGKWIGKETGPLVNFGRQVVAALGRKSA